MEQEHLFDPRMEKWCSADTCYREIINHPHKDGSSSIFGELSVSRFRLRFAAMHTTPDRVSVYNKGFLMPFDIPIVSIYRVTLLNRKKRQKKEVFASDALRNNSSEELEYSKMTIYCSDFMMYKFTTLSEEISFPADFLDLVLDFGVRRAPLKLFGMILGEQKLTNLNVVHKNRSPDDAWLQKFPFESLMPHQMSDVMKSAEDQMFNPKYFADQRAPRISCKVGSNLPSMLLRCGKIVKGKRNTIEHELREAHRKRCSSGSPSGRAANSEQLVRIVKLKTLGLPRPEELQTARRRLREISQGFGVDGSSTAWLDQLEGTQWMTFLSRALRIAGAIAFELRRDLGTVLMLSEGSDSDWNCVICSLVNLLLFPKHRCATGLQELVVREWCVTRHAFSPRLEIALEGAGGPLFPLFLDCVQQLWTQFPQCFAFTPDLLIALHDLSHIGLFREFLVHIGPSAAALAPSVFDLKLLLSPDGAELFENPVFGLAWEMWRQKRPAGDEVELSLEEQLEAVAGNKPWLEVDSDVRFLRFWRENYLRALSFMNIEQGGRPTELWRYRELLFLCRSKRDSGEHTVALGMTKEAEAEDIAVQLRNEANVFRLPSGADFRQVTAFFPFAIEIDQGRKSSHASLFQSRGVSTYTMANLEM